MTSVTGGPDEVWAWMSEPIQRLKQLPDASWPEQREEFLSALGLPEPEAHPAVAVLVRQLDDLADDDRRQLIAGDQLDALAWDVVSRESASAGPGDEAAVAATGEAPPAADAGYDEAGWAGFLADSLPHWDGTDDSWPAFREWFVAAAEYAGVAAPAGGLVAYLDAQTVPERIATFGQYGQMIQPLAGADDGQAPDPGAAPTLSASAESALVEVQAEHPEFAELSEERMRELAAEVMAELEAEGEPAESDESEGDR
jgi:hypothetical protein